jgi:hypothetical protein
LKNHVRPIAAPPGRTYIGSMTSKPEPASTTPEPPPAPPGTEPAPQTKAREPAKVPEIGGRKGPDPTRYGDWEKDGRCVDF